MIVGALLLAVVAGGAGWAARAAFAPVEPPEPVAPYALVDVTEGDLGSTLTTTASASWQVTPVGHNEAAGIVTSVALDAGATIDVGTELYRVDEQPVIAAEGAIPAYRDLSAHATGPDVEQLQAFLAGQGYLDQQPDGRFGPATEAAVRRWHDDLGLAPTGSVGRGTLMFLPELPARIRITDAVARGEHLGGGEPVLEVYSAVPRFGIPLNQGQADAVTPGMAVTLTGPERDWSAVIDRVDELDDGTLLARLAPTPGADAICAEDCAEVPVTGYVTFPASIELVPVVSGMLVPAAALATSADGTYVLVAGDGSRIDVEVLLQSRGYAVVSGVDPGTQVRVPAE